MSDQSPHILRASSESGTKIGSKEPTAGPKVGQPFYVKVKESFLEKWTSSESASLVTEKLECSKQGASIRGGRKHIRSGSSDLAW